MMEALTRLCEAVRVLSPQGEFRLRGVPDSDDLLVVGVVVIGGVILVESEPSTPEEAVAFVTKKLQGMSQRMMRATQHPPAPTGSDPV